MNENARQLYAAAAVYELDRKAIRTSGISSYTLMRRAASAAWSAARDQWPRTDRIAILCGTGNNGGDGYEIACLAHATGCDVQVYAIGEHGGEGDAAMARAAWAAIGPVEVWHERSAEKLVDRQLLIDAIFGIGLSRPVSGKALSAVRSINARHAAGADVLAVDIPSGLHSDTGSVLGEAVNADLTVTFIARKAGLHTGQGPAQAGAVLLNDLGVPLQVYQSVPVLGQLLDAKDLSVVLPRRSRTAHKGSNGHVLIVGGERNTPGAPLLTARAALRSGAGLVSVATRPDHAAALVAAQPELMCAGVENADDLEPLLARASVVAIGPGLGKSDWSRDLLARVLSSPKPLVVDADALNLLAESPARRDDWILTPHPGEAGRLLGKSTKQIEADRFSAVRELQQKYGGVVLLKGAGTLIQGAYLRLCPHGNPGMATGGMGDALTGVIAAFVAQKMSLEHAASMGALAHSKAGDAAAASGGERGLLPTDLIGQLRRIVNP